jgi:hypothetical protein
MGQSQSNANKQLETNRARVKKIEELMTSADPKDQALLAKMLREVDIILADIERSRQEEKDKYMTNKEMSNRNHEKKIRLAAERTRLYENVKAKKKQSNTLTQSRIQRAAETEARNAAIAGA